MGACAFQRGCVSACVRVRVNVRVWGKRVCARVRAWVSVRTCVFARTRVRLG